MIQIAHFLHPGLTFYSPIAPQESLEILSPVADKAVDNLKILRSRDLWKLGPLFRGATWITAGVEEAELVSQDLPH